MKKLKISDKQIFGIHVEECIEEDNMFFHEYEAAVKKLNNIWEIQKGLQKNVKQKGISENPNNIIAFCGERGTGKSSVMLSFMKALGSSGKRQDKFNFNEEIRNNNWSTQIMIDALALGISAADYYRFKGDILVMPKQDFLDNLAWMLVRKEQYGCPADEKLKSLLEQKFYELFYEVYSSEFLQYRSVTYLDYYNSWMLRGDNPENYLLESEKFEHRLTSVPLQNLLRYDFNDAVSNTVRRNEKYRKLFMLYHYDDQVRRKGEKEAIFKVPCGYASLVRAIQDKMIQELVCKGIGIETNPSSNYLIGPLQKYEEHPIIRFNGRKLKETETNMSLQVSINTDDQGVFDTSLENEYALMTIALKKAKTEDEQYKYDMEDIYAWVDYVRRMGITQAFSNSSELKNI